MPLVIPPGYGQASLIFTLQGDPEPMAVTFGVDLQLSAGNHSGALQNIIDAWAAPNGPQSVQSNSYTLTGARLAVGQDGGPPVQVERAANLTGSSTSASLPQNCAVLVRKRTALAGREGRGRMYVPGLPEISVDAAGTLGAGDKISWQAKMDGFLAAIADNTSTASPMVLLHTFPQQGSVPPPTPVTALIVDQRIATQRRRLRR